ncbi:DUF1345 domain-containing protein [Cupriavidus sp. UYPR2.512]|uniref:DUF1345 domain-containing protein n=1 Tax=Cupriavidus sp. UYPR2.512 TaxID=1080187 RepID=UPI001E505956|nr:DUF1345 domain-containing protein [Cupriavidus sp. UYPR2.512]
MPHEQTRPLRYRQAHGTGTLSAVRAILLVATITAGALGAEPRIALLIGFDLAALVFLAAALPLVRADPAAMRRTAQDNDANRVALLTITVLLSMVILVAIGTLIARPRDIALGRRPGVTAWPRFCSTRGFWPSP